MKVYRRGESVEELPTRPEAMNLETFLMMRTFCMFDYKLCRAPGDAAAGVAGWCLSFERYNWNANISPLAGVN